MQKHYDIILLGAGQIAQAILRNSLNKRVLVLCRRPETLSKFENIDCVTWIAGETDVPLGVSGDLVINCIMPGTRRVSRSGIDTGVALLSSTGRYSHISTVAVKARPAGNILSIGFSGDVYIRVKKYELAYLKNKRVNKLIVYPGIVVGANTGWDKFFASLASCETASFGFPLSNRAPIIDIQDLAKDVLRASSLETDIDECFLPDLKGNTLLTWEDCIRPLCCSFTVSSYTYFPSKIKNTIVSLLNSILVPTWVWEKLSKFNKRKRHKQHPNSQKYENEVQNLNVTGMTNFYLGCHYVL